MFGHGSDLPLPKSVYPTANARGIRHVSLVIVLFLGVC